MMKATHWEELGFGQKRTPFGKLPREIQEELLQIPECIYIKKFGIWLSSFLSLQKLWSFEFSDVLEILKT